MGSPWVSWQEPGPSLPTFLQPFVPPNPLHSACRGGAGFAPLLVLLAARSASSPQGTETAGPCESAARSIRADLLTARALGLSGIHPPGNTRKNFRAAEPAWGWDAVPASARSVMPESL